MKSLSFNDGRESFMVNDDPSRVIRFNPADPEIINRALAVREHFSNFKVPDDIELNPDGSPKGDLEKGGAYVGMFTDEMRKGFNGIFNADVYDTIFDGQSPLCIIGQKFLYEVIFDGLFDLMKPALKAYMNKTQGKMGKYLGDIKQ